MAHWTVWAPDPILPDEGAALGADPLQVHGRRRLRHEGELQLRELVHHRLRQRAAVVVVVGDHRPPLAVEGIRRVFLQAVEAQHLVLDVDHGAVEDELAAREGPEGQDGRVPDVPVVAVLAGFVAMQLMPQLTVLVGARDALCAGDLEFVFTRDGVGTFAWAYPDTVDRTHARALTLD